MREPAARPQRVPAFTLPSLLRARDLIDRAFAEPLDLDALAREAGYSKFHFARNFVAAYGETPAAYLTRRRVERAKDLLRSANLTVTEICFMVGFESLGSFSSRFRQFVGTGPRAYRDEHLSAAGAPPIPGCALMMWTRPYPGEIASLEKPPAAAPITVGLPPDRRSQ